MSIDRDKITETDDDGFAWHTYRFTLDPDRTPKTIDLTMLNTGLELRGIYEQLDFGTQRAILKLYRSVKPGTLSAAGERLGVIDSPALIVWGERDPYIPSRAAAQYAAALGGECELALLADAGHWPWLDRPGVVDTVVRFLARN